MNMESSFMALANDLKCVTKVSNSNLPLCARFQFPSPNRSQTNVGRPSKFAESLVSL